MIHFRSARFFAACAAAFGLGTGALLAGDVTFDPILFSGGPAPGVAGASIFYFISASQNAAGDVALTTLLSGGGLDTSSDGASFSLLRDTATPVVRVREGADVPGIAGAKFSVSIFPRINAAGTLAYAASLTGAGVTADNNTSVWQDLGSGPELLIRASDPLPAIATNAVLGTVYSTNIPIDDDGAVCFIAGVTGGTVSPGTKSVFYGRKGALESLGRTGQPATGLTDLGATFEGASEEALSPGGTIAFQATIRIGANIPDHKSALWTRAPGGSLSLLLREGTAAPALTGVALDRLDQLGGVDDAGEVAFVATLAGTGVTTATESSLWVGTTSALRMVARGGQRAAGTPEGVVFDHFNVGDSPRPAINEDGHVTFGATLVGPGVTADNDYGIWAEDNLGHLRLVVRTGDLLASPVGSLPVTQLNFDSLSAYHADEFLFIGRFANTRFTLFRAAIPPGEPAAGTGAGAPHVDVRGPRHFSTEASSVVLRGRAAAASVVQVKVPGRPYRAAHGTATWHFSARLRPGRNKILVRAIGAEGEVSAPIPVIVRRG